MCSGCLWHERLGTKGRKNPERKEVSKLSKSHRVVSSQSRSKREISRFIYNLGFIPLNLWLKSAKTDALICNQSSKAADSDKAN